MNTNNNLQTTKLFIQSINPKINNEVLNNATNELNIINFSFSIANTSGYSITFKCKGIITYLSGNMAFGNNASSTNYGQRIYQTTINNSNTREKHILVQHGDYGVSTTYTYPYYRIEILSCNTAYLDSDNLTFYLKNQTSTELKNGTLIIDDDPAKVYNIVYGEGLIYSSNSSIYGSSNKLTSVFITPGRELTNATSSLDATADYGIIIKNITSNNTNIYRRTGKMSITFNNLFVIKKTYEDKKI